MQVSKNQMIFIFGCVGFLGVCFLVSVFLLVGAVFGAFGMFFVLPFFQKYIYESKKRKLARLQKEILKLNGEVYG